VELLWVEIDNGASEGVYMFLGLDVPVDEAFVVSLSLWNHVRICCGPAICFVTRRNCVYQSLVPWGGEMVKWLGSVSYCAEGRPIWRDETT